MDQNDHFRFLHIALPTDIAQRKAAGDLAGAGRLIDRRLAGDCEPELAHRLLAEKVRLERLACDYPFTRAQALEKIRAEWPECTEAQFDALVDAGHIRWCYINGEERYFERFLAVCKMYPKDAPGLKAEEEDHTRRDQMLARMHDEGSLTARITVKATVAAAQGAQGKQVRAWLPIPAACPQQSEIEILSATPGAKVAPADAPQRTIYWESTDRDRFEVTYRYLHRAPYVDPFTIDCDPIQPVFDLQEELPHIQFTPYLRALAARLSEGCKTPVERAWACYKYVTDHVDYRYQPFYLQLDPIADTCAKTLRGDCGVMAILFITLCRLCGVPARWQSGLHVTPDSAGAHDWAMFYVAPYGWLFADPSFGSSARRNGEPERQKHYFGNLDPCRMVANSAFQAPLTPPDPAQRHDPFDNQTGEMSVDGVGLYGAGLLRTQEVVNYQFL